MVTIAIDPGANGGVAISSDGDISVVAMPETDSDIVKLIKCAFEYYPDGIKRAVVEKVGGYIGGEGQPGSAMFNFGHNVGVVIGALIALGFRIERPTPQQWQRALGLGTSQKEKAGKGATQAERKAIKQRNATHKREWKNKLKAKAQELFPDQKVTLKTADALLILEAARRASF